MRIYRLLIMFGHIMGWASVWAAGGPGPSSGPLARLLWALGALLVISKSVKFSLNFFKLAA